ARDRRVRVGEPRDQLGLHGYVTRSAERLERRNWRTSERADQPGADVPRRILVERGGNADRAQRGFEQLRIPVVERALERGPRLTAADAAEAAQRELARVPVIALREHDQLLHAAGAPRFSLRDAHAQPAVVGDARRPRPIAWTTDQQTGSSEDHEPQH